MEVKGFKRGSGPEVFPGYARGDSWLPVVGAHTNCQARTRVVGPGLVRVGLRGSREGLLLRCDGCLISWVEV